MARDNQYNWDRDGTVEPTDMRSLEHSFQHLPRSPIEALEPARGVQPPERRQRQEIRRRQKGSGGYMKLFNGFLTFVLMVMIAVGLLFFFIKVQFDSPGPLEHSTVITIAPGSGLNKIATTLQREGVIGDSRIFVGSAIYFKAQKKLKAGEYEFRKNDSMRQVLDRLVEGKAILQKVTIREGLTSQQTVSILNNHEMMRGEITKIPAEGSLLPDTYKFSRNMDRQELVDRMQAEQRKFVKRLWEQRARGLPIQSPEEAIILASIVERETGRSDERDRVAGVFVNRLRRGMRLQSDPTIIYGIVGGQGSLGRPLRKSEIARKTAYNTYQIDGLPPTPIGNPGRAAIEAVLNPADTKDIFFVADGTGGHAFSQTLRGHNRNVAKWRKIERGIRAAQKKRAAELKEAAVTAKTAAADTSQAAATDTDVPGLAIGGGSAVRGSTMDSSPALVPTAQPLLAARARVSDGQEKSDAKAATAADTPKAKRPTVPMPVQRP